MLKYRTKEIQQVCYPIVMLVLLVTFWSNVSFASFRLVAPESGSWFNHEANNKTGLNMEFQGGHLSGAYYGFDGSGEQVWLLFSGRLNVNTGGSGMYTFSGDLTRSSGGGCIIDCAGADGIPHSVETVGTIDIEFMARSLARFRVNDNEYQTIMPLTYGTAAERVFEPELAPPLVDFTGFWTLEYDLAFFCSHPDFATVLSIRDRTTLGHLSGVRYTVDETSTGEAIFQVPQLPGLAQASSVPGKPAVNIIGQQSSENSGDLSIGPQCTPPAYTFFLSAEMVCERVQEDGEEKAVCLIQANEEVPLEMAETVFKFYPADTSDARIEGVVMYRFPDSEGFSANGQFRAWKLHYD